jgi:hypothetical protein
VTVRIITTAIAFTILWGCTPKNNIAKTNFSNLGGPSAKLNVHNILITGAGSMASRLFLENLTEALTLKFKKEGSITQYHFLENTNLNDSFKLETVDSFHYDVLIVLFPITAANLTINHANEPVFPLRFDALLGRPGLSPNNYQQLFGVSVYSRIIHPKLVWRTGLNLNFDLAEDRDTYKEITKFIFKELSDNYFNFR